MSLLIPLGLLGLLGIVALIIIYIIKPNYQQKFVTSTYVWQLAKKYRKKKIPLNRLRDILLVICQILIVTACALILSKPALITGVKTDKPEIIAVIDSSASMLTKGDDGKTRFERAVSATRKLVADTLKADGKVSVIFANESPYYILQEVGADETTNADDTLSALTTDNCGFGVSDINGALKMCNDVVAEKPETRIYVYTDNSYIRVPDGVTLKRSEVVSEDEWNISVLNAYVEKVDNYYNLNVEIGCYSAQPRTVNVKTVITGSTNADGTLKKPVTLTDSVLCKDESTYRIAWQSVATDDVEGDVKSDHLRVFSLYDETTKLDDRFNDFEKISITIDAGEEDSFTADNSFEVYGGKKHEIKIQYYSKLDNQPGQNPFVRATLYALQSRYADNWKITLDEVGSEQTPAIKGYDYYIFEHAMPDAMPTDGFVFLIHPDKAPTGSGLSLGGEYELPDKGEFDGGELSYGTDGESSPLLREVKPTNISVKQYRRVNDYDDSYKCIMTTTDGYPALLFKNEPSVKVAVLTFSLHFSNLPLLPEFPLLMDNVFSNVFKPATDNYAYEVNGKVVLNCMGEALTLKGSGPEIKFSTFPAEYKPTVIGAYTVTQAVPFLGMGDDGKVKTLEDTFFVHINEDELNIFAVHEELFNPFNSRVATDYQKDLLLYLAIALVALLFIEWILKITDNV